MQRRDFLRLMAGTVVILPVGTFLVGCGESADEYGPASGADAPAAAPRASGTSNVYSSSNTDGHFHELTLAAAMLTAPPAAGFSGSTALSVAHQHSVTISMAQLAEVETGGTVKVTTGAETGHTHVFTLVKVSASSTPTPDGQPGPGQDAEPGDDDPGPYVPPY